MGRGERMNRRNFVTSLIAASLATQNYKDLRKIYKKMPDGSVKRVRMYELKAGDAFCMDRVGSHWFTAISEPYLKGGKWGVTCV